MTWIIRCKIALGIAHGLEYLHSIRSSDMSHGNIKSSNIMININYDAFVSEYCIINLVSSSSSLSNSSSSHSHRKTSNRYGYGAPELINIKLLGSQKSADVYSFGVLLLELLTGKDPNRTTTTTAAEKEEEIDNLPKWVRSVVQEKWTIQVFDTELLTKRGPTNSNNNYSEEQMVQLLYLAIACTSRLPEKRPSMKDVVVRIEDIYLLSSS